MLAMTIRFTIAGDVAPSEIFMPLIKSFPAIYSGKCDYYANEKGESSYYEKAASAVLWARTYLGETSHAYGKVVADYEDIRGKGVCFIPFLFLRADGLTSRSLVAAPGLLMRASSQPSMVDRSSLPVFRFTFENIQYSEDSLEPKGI